MRSSFAQRPGIMAQVVYFDHDQAIATGLLQRNPAALDALYTKYVGYVRTLLVQILGHGDTELDDRTQEVFLSAWNDAHRLRDPRRLKAWLGSVAVHKAIDAIRAKKRHNWLRFAPVNALPDVPESPERAQAAWALRTVYAILNRIPAKERVPFCLRRIEGLDLTEVAALCGLSPATAHRRIAAAHRKFVSRASRHPLLAAWLDERGIWRQP